MLCFVLFFLFCFCCVLSRAHVVEQHVHQVNITWDHCLVKRGELFARVGMSRDLILSEEEVSRGVLCACT